MVIVSALRPDDQPAWQELFTGYNTFYERSLPSHIYDQAWKEFQRDDRMHALGARSMAAWSESPTSWCTSARPAPDVCYLQDLFTAPEARGQGVARTLIRAVEDWARDQGCARVYWHTKEATRPGGSMTRSFSRVGVAPFRSLPLADFTGRVDVRVPRTGP